MKIMAFGPITSWQIDGETMETVTDFIFLDSKITADGDCNHEFERRLFLGRIAMTNLVKWSEVAQSCLTLCNPMDCSLPGSSVHGIFQARILEWVVISFSRGSSRPRDRTRVPLIVGRRFTLCSILKGSQGYGFSSSHVWMWELDHRESWALKNWCFWTMVLEKIVESPLDCKKIKPIN